MKHNLFLLSLFAFLCLDTSAAILRVNNNTGSTTAYTTAQAAHNAAATGDTIHIESSPNSYGNLTCTKKLTWIGNGYFTDPTVTGFNPGLQSQPAPSRLDLISANSGSADSYFSGLMGQINIGTSNITIKRCYVMPSLYFTSGNTVSNTNVTQCFIWGDIQLSGSPAVSSNILIHNNIITGSVLLSPSNLSNISIQNNFIGSGNIATIPSGIIANNIIHNASGNVSISSNSGAVINNLFMNQTNTNYVGSNGNIFVSGSANSTNTVFTNAKSVNYDNWCILKAGSPAIGGGGGGVDMGPRGGATPYVLSGVPAVPSVYQLTVTSTPSTTTLPCVISTKSNN